MHVGWAPACLALILVACGPEGEASSEVSGEPGAAPELPHPIASQPFKGDPAEARAGRVHFVQNNCYGCHGGQAGGTIGPSLRDGEWSHGGSDSAIARSIREGHPDKGMPPFEDRLSPKEIAELVSYIRSLRTPAEPVFFIEAWDDTMQVARGTP